MATPLGSHSGSSLNLRWANVAFDGYLPFVLLYACVIIAHWGFWCGDFLCLIDISICDIDILMILIDSLDCLSILILLLPWLPYSFWHICSHCCISRCLSDWIICLYIILIVFEHAVFVTIHLDCHSLYVDMSDISVLCLTVCCMTALLCVIACRLSMWAAHLSPYLQSFGFRSFLSFWLSLLQVWGFVCACFSDRARW